MLLDVEVAIWVESVDGQDLGERNTNGEGQQLCNKGHDMNTRISEREELVDTGAEKDEDLCKSAWLCRGFMARNIVQYRGTRRERC